MSRSGIIHAQFIQSGPEQNAQSLMHYHSATVCSRITCSTIVLQCYRRQAVPMEQAKIRPSVTTSPITVFINFVFYRTAWNAVAV